MTKLIMLVGPAGCGKSTLAKELRGLVLSSDAVRAELYGRESDQGNSKEVFAKLNAMVDEHIGNGATVIYDATNLKKYRRIALIDHLRKIAPECIFECYDFGNNAQVCLAQNDKRERKVPQKVILQQCLAYEAPTLDEGWNKIVPIGADDGSCAVCEHRHHHHHHFRFMQHLPDWAMVIIHLLGHVAIHIIIHLVFHLFGA